VSSSKTFDDSFLELQAKLDEEHGRLQVVDDRKLFTYESSSFSVFPPHRPIIFLSIYTVSRKPSDLEPAYIVDAVHELGKRLLGKRLSFFAETTLSVKAQANATLN